MAIVSQQPPLLSPHTPHITPHTPHPTPFHTGTLPPILVSDNAIQSRFIP
ncbi:MAG: hypothetical protein KME27_19480 [Lyngbya sp. HA4199-MV5]|nr:hypothetical protein [Lyngbya sp. HA4199-MV5]